MKKFDPGSSFERHLFSLNYMSGKVMLVNFMIGSFIARWAMRVKGLWRYAA